MCVCVCECVCVFGVRVRDYIKKILMCTRVVHSFTCAGISTWKFSMFAGMGRVGHKYMEKGNL